jgi:basic amino acid/polyamine antiporter, APA family
MRRALTAFDALCLGVNAVVGSGIYLFPGKLAQALGPASVLAWLVTGLCCLPLALAYAALGAREERTGGSFRYAELAFGKGVGFVVGWSAWVTSVISWAAVASALPSYLEPFAPGLSRGVPARLESATIVLALAVVNVLGVRPGARVTDALTLLKLAPLLLFVALGLAAVEPARFGSLAPHGLGELPSLTLMTLFAYQGFEVVGIPSGEVKDPRRAVPRAVLLSLAFPAALYVLVQVVFVGVGGTATDAPLADAARRFMGPFGATLLACGGLVSMLGFNAGTALCTPRYLQALAEERLMPAWLGRIHARYATPAAAITASAGVTLVLLQVLDFDSLVDLAALAVLLQYLASSAALVRLGRGWTRWLGVVAVVVSVFFGFQGRIEELVILGLLTAVGLLIARLSRSGPIGP